SLFYGMAPNNGVTGGGIVFTLDVSTTPATFRTLHEFDQCCIFTPQGSFPQGALVKGAGGWFYGATETGGPNSYGTAFGVNSSGTVRLIGSFGGADGANPTGGLTLAPDGSFYGVTN